MAFLRAINVAGHARVAMTDLAAAFSAAGCREVTTYIQSGNVLFTCDPGRTAATCANVRARVRALIGGEPEIVFRTAGDIEGLVRRAPFAAFESEPGIKLYVAFLAAPPPASPTFPLLLPKEGLEAFGMTKADVFIVSRRKPNGFYGFPNNFIERELGVTATSRNWSTVTKIAGLLG